MEASFFDLVGAAGLPAHCFDSTELTDLTPALDTAMASRDMAEPAIEDASANPVTDLVGMACGISVHTLV